MQESVKNILKEARYAAIELKSLDEALKMLEGRLFGLPGQKLTRETPGIADPTAKEELMDHHGDLIEKIVAERERTRAAIAKAEAVIELAKNPKVRAALRYYYVCRKSTQEIAKLLGQGERTVKRWVYGD